MLYRYKLQFWYCICIAKIKNTNVEERVLDREVLKLEVPDVATAIGVLGASPKRERFLLDKSIVDTKKKQKLFEEKNRMRSEDFFDKFDKGLAGDDQDTML